MNWEQVFADHYGQKPSVQAPELSNHEFARAVRLATALKFGQGSGHASAQEAASFWREYLPLQHSDRPISDEEFLHHVETLAPLSFRYHDRPPKIFEILKLRDASPQVQREYYGKLPDPRYPDLTAHEMLAARAVADHYAVAHLRRPALDLEARMFHHGNMGPAQVGAYYQSLLEDRNARGQSGGNPAPDSSGTAGLGGALAGAQGAGSLGRQPQPIASGFPSDAANRTPGPAGAAAPLR